MGMTANIRNICIAILCLSVALCAYRVSVLADSIPSKLDDLSKALYSEILTTRLDIEAVASQTNLRVGDTLARADRALSTIEHIYMIAEKAENDANSQISQALAVSRDTLGQAVTELKGVREDLKPVLVNASETIKQAGELVKQGNTLVADNYFDIQSGIQSGVVATTSLARMGDEWAKAGPLVTGSVAGISHNTDGITADIHTVTSDFVKPKTKWQRFKAALLDIGKVAALVLW